MRTSEHLGDKGTNQTCNEAHEAVKNVKVSSKAGYVLVGCEYYWKYTYPPSLICVLLRLEDTGCIKHEKILSNGLSSNFLILLHSHPMHVSRMWGINCGEGCLCHVSSLWLEGDIQWTLFRPKSMIKFFLFS